MALPVTAAAERGSQFETVIQPGGRLWVKAPQNERGFRLCPDLHLSLGDAEDLAYVLLQAVEEAVALDLDLDHGLPGVEHEQRAGEVLRLQDCHNARRRDLDQAQGRLLLRVLRARGRECPGRAERGWHRGGADQDHREVP